MLIVGFVYIYLYSILTCCFMKKKRAIKALSFSIIIIFFALLPLTHNFIPINIDYEETKTTVNLKEGINEVGDVLVYVQNNEVYKIENKEYTIVNKFSGFKCFADFLFMTSPYFSLLFITLFLGYLFFQIKERSIRNVTKTIFVFYLYTSIFYLIWALVPNPDLPVVYYRIYVAIGAIFVWFIILAIYRYCENEEYSLRRKIQILIEFILYSKDYVMEERKTNYINRYYDIFEKIISSKKKPNIK